jgi:hypothetical protein
MKGGRGGGRRRGGVGRAQNKTVRWNELDTVTDPLALDTARASCGDRPVTASQLVLHTLLIDEQGVPVKMIRQLTRRVIYCSET